MAKDRANPVQVRLPASLLEKLKKAADDGDGTLNGEIAGRLGQSFAEFLSDPTALALRHLIDAVLSEYQWFGETNPARARQVMATGVKAALIPLLDRLGADETMPEVERQIGERNAAKILNRARQALEKKSSDRSDEEAALAAAGKEWGLSDKEG